MHLIFNISVPNKTVAAFPTNGNIAVTSSIIVIPYQEAASSKAIEYYGLSKNGKGLDFQQKMVKEIQKEIKSAANTYTNAYIYKCS